MIVVVDASTLISAALKADSLPERALLRAVNEPNRLLLSQELEDEYREVLFRRKFDTVRLHRAPAAHSGSRRRRSGSDRASAAVRECRDPKDDKYLALALAGKATVIVSSDIHHLLSMHPWRGIQILSPADYLALKEA